MVSPNCLYGLIDWRGDATPKGAYAMPWATPFTVGAARPFCVIYTKCPSMLGKLATISLAELTRSFSPAPFQQHPLSKGDVPCHVSRFSRKRNSLRIVGDTVHVQGAV